MAPSTVADKNNKSTRWSTSGSTIIWVASVSAAVIFSAGFVYHFLKRHSRLAAEKTYWKKKRENDDNKP